VSNYQLSIKNYPFYKDSGIEWIGDVPEHWQIKRLKDIGTSIIGITYAPEDALGDEASGLLVLRSSNIQNGQLSMSDTVYVNKQVNPRQIVKKGDILICSRNGSRTLIGKNICIDERMEGQTFGAFMTVYRSKYFRFISKFFNSNIFVSQSGLFSSSTINQLTINTLNNFLLIFPPLSEQKTIATYLDTKTAQIDQIIQTINTQIEKLKELRKTLINDVVTGKIRVTEN
jgi:type I restriction enzyme, S subunit